MVGIRVGPKIELASCPIRYNRPSQGPGCRDVLASQAQSGGVLLRRFRAPQSRRTHQRIEGRPPAKIMVNATSALYLHEPVGCCVPSNMLTYTLVLPLQFALQCCSAAAHLLMKEACSEAGTLSFTWDRQYAPAAEQEAGSACTEQTTNPADRMSPATGAIDLFTVAPQLDETHLSDAAAPRLIKRYWRLAATEAGRRVPGVSVTTTAVASVC